MRSNGEGSIVATKTGFRGAIQIAGKRYWVSGKTRSDVVTKLRALQNNASVGTLAPVNRLTVADHVTDWLAKGSHRRLSTNLDYGYCLNTHVLPVIGSLRLQRLDPLHLAHLYTQLQQKGLTNQRIQRVHVIIGKCLEDAVQWQRVSRNVARVVRPPRADQIERRIWTLEQTQQFLAHCRTSTRLHAPLFIFLIGTGLRVGEALGLRWDDIDLDQNILHITRSTTFVAGVAYIDTPKTKHGIRSFYLPEIARSLIDSLPRGSDLLFPSRVGTFIKPTSHRRGLHLACAEAGVPRLRVHDLRHVHTSLALAAGMDLHTIQRRLGHSSSRTTLRIYAHTLREAERAAVGNFDALLRGELTTSKGREYCGFRKVLMGDEQFQADSELLENLVCNICQQPFKLVRLSSDRVIFSGKHEMCGKSVVAEPSEWTVRVYTDESD